MGQHPLQQGKAGFPGLEGSAIGRTLQTNLNEFVRVGKRVISKVIFPLFLTTGKQEFQNANCFKCTRAYSAANESAMYYDRNNRVRLLRPSPLICRNSHEWTAARSQTHDHSWRSADGLSSTIIANWNRSLLCWQHSPGTIPRSSEDRTIRCPALSSPEHLEGIDYTTGRKGPSPNDN